MLLLLALASPAPSVPARIQAVATVRIERPVTADRESWEKLEKSRRSKTIVRDEQGRALRLRLVENP